MLMTDLIAAKRDGGKLSAEEIDFMVQGYTKGEIPDYQMSAMCMAILLRGMDDEETMNLTMSMMHSGEVLDLSAIKGVKPTSIPQAVSAIRRALSSARWSRPAG